MWFIIITTLLTLGWMVYRREYFKHENFLESFLSREASFVLLNWVLTLMTLAIFCGTVMPAVSELITGRKVSVDAAFYNRVSWPLALVLLLLIGVSALLSWKKTLVREIQLRLSISLAAGILTGAVLLLSGMRQGIALAFFSSAAFVITAILGKLLMVSTAFKREHHTSILVSAWRVILLSNRLICSSLVHVGVVMVLVGIISSSLFNREETFVVREWEVFRMEDYTLTFKGVKQDHDELKDILTAEVEVERGGRVSGVLRPQKHFHHRHEQPMTEIALEQSLFQDLYLILYGWDGEGNFSFRIIINPLIRFIWWGVCLMCLAVSWRFGYMLINTKRKSVSG